MITYYDLRQTGDRLHIDVPGPFDPPDQSRQGIRLTRERVEVLSKYFTNHILSGSCDQFIEPHLHGILETGAQSGYFLQGGAHLVGQFVVGFGRGPFLFVLQTHDDIGHLHGHGIGGDLTGSDPGHDAFHFGKSSQNRRSLAGHPDRFRQRTARQQPGIDRKISLFQLRDEFTA